MARLHVIYVPGLGDDNPRGQRLLVSTWRLWGVTPHLLQMYWSTGEHFEPKLRELLDYIDKLHKAGNSVALVGASAGAGAVINAFAARKDKLVGVVCIAGKINNPDAIGTGYSHKNPAFLESAFMVQPSLDKLDFDIDRPRILSRFAVFDPIVPKWDSEIAGGENQTLPSIGHSTTIAAQLLFGAPVYLRSLKRLARSRDSK